MSREVSIIMDEEGRKIVIINNIRFKRKSIKEWDEIEKFLYEYEFTQDFIDFGIGKYQKKRRIYG